MTGVLIVMVMRMLGEMAVANPSTGSFADYARQRAGRLGGLLGRLAVLVLLGDRRRLRGGRRARRSSSTGSTSRCGCLARPDGPDDGDQPVLGVVVRRVRVLVRRHQGGRDRRVPRCSARCSSSGMWPNKSPRLLQPHRPRRVLPQRCRRDLRRHRRWSSSRWSAPRSPPSPPPNRTTRSGPSPRPPTR